MPGGWAVPVNERGEIDENGRRLEAETFDGLINSLRDYRANNGLQSGAPESELSEYICRKYPRMCGFMVNEEPKENDYERPLWGQQVKKSLAERLANWVANRFQKLGQINFVAQEEAERRASICLACPQNISWTRAWQDCPGCQPRLQKLKADLVKLCAGKMTTRDSKLMACAITGQGNSTAVFLSEPALRHRKNYLAELEKEAPHCWLLGLKDS